MDGYMLTPEEIGQFFEGELGGVLELSYDGDNSVIRLVLIEKNNVIAHIPVIGGCPDNAFSIEAALAHPMCGASYNISVDEYEVEIQQRFQIRSVIKIALSHLGWEDEKSLHTMFAE
jgi:hypothetical protein